MKPADVITTMHDYISGEIPAEQLPTVEEVLEAWRMVDAADDLLAACDEINNWCGTGDGAHSLPFEPPWYKQLRAAIAKAKGKQS